MDISFLTNKYKNFHSSENLWISAIEVFATPPHIQKCENVKIFSGFPFSTINFRKQDTIIALLTTSIKTKAPYAYENAFNFFLNNYQIDIPSTDNLEDFEPLLNSQMFLEKNVISVEILSIDSKAYFDHILVYTQKNEDDFFMFTKELSRWRKISNNEAFETDEEV